jgi:hypothetical protein
VITSAQTSDLDGAFEVVLITGSQTSVEQPDRRAISDARSSFQGKAHRPTE